MSGHYMAMPASLSRRAVLDVGLKCPSACQHCFTREPGRASEGKDFERNNKAPWRPTEQLIRQVELMKDHGFVAFDVTGGEPTLHPGIVDIIQRATDVGLASRIITLGQYLDRKDILHRILDAGLTDFRMSYHACDGDIFRAMTGGDVLKIEAAMDRLNEIGFQYTTNTTITSANYRHLPKLAASIAKRKVYSATFLNMMSHYDHAASADEGLRAKYSDVAPFMREATDILEDAGIAVAVRYAPMCTMAGLERNLVGQVGVRYDHHEWMNAVEHSGPGDAERESLFLPEQQGHPASGAMMLAAVENGPPIGRGTQAGPTKLFAPICHECSAIMVCDGIDPGYLEAHGADELVPYVGGNCGQVLHPDRVNYLPGQIIKLKPDGNPKGAIRRLLHPKTVEPFPLVSIVVANYNHGDTIERCLESIAAQTYRHIEVVVVDDGSTDNSVAVVNRVCSVALTLIERGSASGGPATPRNIGIRSSSGSLVMVLDPDDYLAPSCIEEAVRVFRRAPWASIVYPGLQTFGMETVQWAAAPFDPAKEIMGNFIPVMSLYRRSMYDDIGGYDESAEVAGCEDWLLWVSAVRLGHLAAPLPRQLVHYCRSETGLFETEVKPNFEAKRNAVYRRNQEAYHVEVALAAQKGSTPMSG